MGEDGEWLPINHPPEPGLIGDWDGPYPLHDLVGYLAAKGEDPTSVDKYNAKHGLMACCDCHDQATTSTRTADVLMPPKQKCVECHTNTGGSRERARADCLECHQYHSSGQGHFRESNKQLVSPRLPE